jgi:hypothetical protein
MRYVIRLKLSGLYWSGERWVGLEVRPETFTSRKAAAEKRRSLKLWPLRSMKIEAIDAEEGK